MTTLAVGNIKSTTTSPPIIRNSSNTEIGYFCRAWVNFDGTGTVTIRASGNVSSITDNTTGDYTLNFNTAMVDANYSICGTANGNIQQLILSPYITVSTTQCRVISSNTTSLADNSFISVAIFR
jgi:hypothetical protein